MIAVEWRWEVAASGTREHASSPPLISGGGDASGALRVRRSGWSDARSSAGNGGETWRQEQGGSDASKHRSEQQYQRSSTQQRTPFETRFLCLGAGKVQYRLTYNTHTGISMEFNRLVRQNVLWYAVLPASFVLNKNER